MAASEHSERFRVSEIKRAATNWHHKKKRRESASSFCGATGNRTRDTRIFSPLLYQLSYDTRTFCLKCGCKDTHFFNSGKFLGAKIFSSSKKTLPLHRQTTGSECSAVGSALRSGRRGRAFESPHSDKIGEPLGSPFLSK